MNVKTEELFRNINILEEWYKKDFITLDMYYQIKSRIIDKHLEDLKENEDNGDLPF